MATVSAQKILSHASISPSTPPCRSRALSTCRRPPPLAGAEAAEHENYENLRSQLSIFLFVCGCVKKQVESQERMLDMRGDIDAENAKRHSEALDKKQRARPRRAGPSPSPSFPNTRCLPAMRGPMCVRASVRVRVFGCVRVRACACASVCEGRTVVRCTWVWVGVCGCGKISG